MVQLIESDILTREVLEWTGLHLFHFAGSSCSQKTRICLNLKKLNWKGHHLDLGSGDNYTEYYLGINPRGLVPTLVHDGEVHIESNDIIVLLDERFPESKLVPTGLEDQLVTLLRHEDDLHLDLRTITFRFTQPRGKEPRSKETLKNYEKRGTGTVRGKVDSHKERELEFWRGAANNGITDQAVRSAAGKFRVALEDLNSKLQDNRYLIGDELSVLDVAWVIYVNRLVRCGYPLKELHPRVDEWYWALRNRPDFDAELQVPADVQKAVDSHHARLQASGTTLVDVMGA
jgi:glutathione S-transferase